MLHHRSAVDAHGTVNVEGVEPPKPLILGGMAQLSAVTVQDRQLTTVIWHALHKCIVELHVSDGPTFLVGCLPSSMVCS
jgi:hypothetical protein